MKCVVGVKRVIDYAAKVRSSRHHFVGGSYGRSFPAPARLCRVPENNSLY